MRTAKRSWKVIIGLALVTVVSASACAPPPSTSGVTTGSTTVCAPADQFPVQMIEVTMVTVAPGATLHSQISAQFANEFALLPYNILDPVEGQIYPINLPMPSPNGCLSISGSVGLEYRVTVTRNPDLGNYFYWLNNLQYGIYGR